MWDHRAGVYNPQLADQLDLVRQQEEHAQREAHAAAQLDKARAVVSAGGARRSASPSPERRSGASPQRRQQQQQQQQHAAGGALQPLGQPGGQQLSGGGQLPPLATGGLAYVHVPARGGFADGAGEGGAGGGEGGPPPPPNLRALRASVGRSVIRRHVTQQLAALPLSGGGSRSGSPAGGAALPPPSSQQGRRGAAAAAAAAASPPPPPAPDALPADNAYALAMELHALAHQFGVQLDAPEDGELPSPGGGDTRASAPPPGAQAQERAERQQASAMLRAALSTPGVFEWDRLLLGPKQTLAKSLAREGAGGSKRGPPVRAVSQRQLQPAGALLAREIRRLRQVVREQQQSPSHAPGAAAPGEFGADGGAPGAPGGNKDAAAQHEGHRQRTAAAIKAATRQQEAPLIHFESESLAESRKIVLQLQEVRAVKNLLWDAEARLVPLRQKRRKAGGAALLLSL